MNLISIESKFFKALAHPKRLTIIKKLGKEVKCVCELNEDEDLDLSQSNLSQHLSILREANIVIQKREGTRINYQLKNLEILKIVEIADEIIYKEIQEMIGKLGDE